MKYARLSLLVARSVINFSCADVRNDDVCLLISLLLLGIMASSTIPVGP